MKIMTEEDYCAQKGASFLDIGDPALHRQPGSTEKSRAKLANMQAAKDHALLSRRAALRREYKAAVEAGTVRPPTIKESLLSKAGGHEDHESTHAARRILKRKFNIEVTS